MEQETNKVTAPADNGLKEVTAKMDQFLAGLEAEKAQNAQTLKAAQEAQKKAQEALDAAVAAKNAHPVNFAPAAESVQKKSATSENLRAFLKSVKASQILNVKELPLTTGTEPGSFIVPEEFSDLVLETFEKKPAYINETYRYPWGSRGNERVITNITAAPVMADVVEGQLKVVSNPKFVPIRQKLHKSAAICLLTNEEVEDNAIDLVSRLRDLYARASVDYFNTWLFSGRSASQPGIFTVSGSLAPTVNNATDLMELKMAVPGDIRANGKFYVESSIYAQLAKLSSVSAPKWLYYEDGKMRIDGSEIVVLDAALIGAKGRVAFGDLGTVIFSPKKELEVRFSNQANITVTNEESGADVTTTYQLFQQNMQAYLFEGRADVTIIGKTWATATINEESAS